jgi:EAL domain-containing protein (putative c-di-GMP-specific phosphodiesterase class I)
VRTQTRTLSPDVELDRLLRRRDVRSVFQPLVDLSTGATVGFEALARGPAGSPLESPAALFGTAYRTGRVAELDWVCRSVALRTALDAGLNPALSLFVNSEPASVRAACPVDLWDAVADAGRRLRVVMEVTERAVAADPAGLLAAIARARANGWGVALDDVGAEPASLAVMPFVRPDVIKLDLGLIHNRPTLDVARTVSAVLAQAERTGATVLAEGIETPQHADVARAMGATIGQGWYFGRPGPLPAATFSPGRLPVPHEDVEDAGTTPFQVVAGRRPVTRVSKDLLMPMSLHLEHNGLDPHDPIVLLACFQEARHFTAGTRRRFSRLAEHAAFVGAVGVGMPTVPAPGVRGGDLRTDDPLRGEWDVIAVGPHVAGALVARDCGDDGPERGRRFDYAITHDRDLVIRAARTLLATLVPA